MKSTPSAVSCTAVLLLFFSVLIVECVTPQTVKAQELRRLDVERIASNRVAVFQDYTQYAAVIVESSVPNLRINSTLGIVADLSEPAIGVYRVIIEPRPQILTFEAPGFMQSRIGTGPLQARQVVDFTVEPQTRSENLISVIFNVTPADAQIAVDGELIRSGETVALPAGTREVRIEREGYRAISDFVEVSDRNIQFNYRLDEIDIVPVRIRSNVEGARVVIDGTERGEIDRGLGFDLFLFPGSYTLLVNEPGYVPVSQVIQVLENSSNEFRAELIRNVGTLVLNVSPSQARVLINQQDYSGENRIELTPGSYQLEISQSGYLPFSETVVVELGETTEIDATLIRNLGSLVLNVEPSDAKILINRQEHQNRNRFDLAPGRYRIEIQKEGYEAYAETVDLERNQTIERQISLIPQFGALQFSVTPSNASVQLLNAAGSIVNAWSGIQIIRELQVGPYTLRATAEGHLPEEQQIVIVLDETLRVNLVMEEGLPGPCKAPTVTDIDGNTYRTVAIGDQCWMAENLNTSRYRDGSAIPNVRGNADWTRRNSGAWAYYNNDASNGRTYGKLYNWYAVNDRRGVCPHGWRVPSDRDWTILEDYLGGRNVAGGKLKSTRTRHWRSPNTGATNESGFSALPGGWRLSSSGTFYNLRSFGNWWSSSDVNTNDAVRRRFFHDSASVNRSSNLKGNGFSIRCVTD